VAGDADPPGAADVVDAADVDDADDVDDATGPDVGPLPQAPSAAATVATRRSPAGRRRATIVR
jgi:hypothetical protein